MFEAKENLIFTGNFSLFMNSTNQFVIRSLRGKYRVKKASSTQFNFTFLRDHFGIQTFPTELQSVVFVIASVMNSLNFHLL